MDTSIPWCDTDTREVRSHYRQCQKCWKRKADGVKLSVCSACKIASYCSPGCQKADWKFHKDACKRNEEYRESMLAHDLAERWESELLGKPTRPGSMTVNGEMGDFLRRFRPAICQASYRCFGVQQGASDAWKKLVFVLRIERLPNPPPESKNWARYKIVDAKAEPFAHVVEGYRDDLDPTLKQGETYHEENVRVGCIGTITTSLQCDSAGRDIRIVSWAGYGYQAWDDDIPCPDWRRTLVETVEKAAGRMH